MLRYLVHLHRKMYVAFFHITWNFVRNVQLYLFKMWIIFYIFFFNDIKKYRNILNIIYESREVHVTHYVRLSSDAQKEPNQWVRSETDDTIRSNSVNF